HPKVMNVIKHTLLDLQSHHAQGIGKETL
ncbi:MAG: hypothetical protein QOD46_541, partial [Actinomycetota bacterium]|nr:hypothetical protein [Actinomycetota bacterium]